MDISKSRLRELELIEAKMSALEGAGVDNWEGYGEAMQDIEEQERIVTLVSDAVERSLEVLQESAFEPSERGAGFSASEEAQEEAFVILTKCINEAINKS